MSFFDNRFTRLVLGVVLQVVAVALACYFIGGSFGSDIVSFWFASYAVGIVGLILFDLLDIGFLDGTTGRIIKLVIFYLILLAAVALTLGTDMPSVGRLAERFNNKMGYGNALMVSVAGSAVPLVATAVTVFTRTEYFDDQRYPLAFSVAIGYAASLIIGLIMGAIFQNGANFNGVYIASFVISLVILILVTVFLGLPFDYENEYWWCLKDVLFRGRRRHRYSSSGSSSSSYGRSSSSSSSSSSSGRSSSSGSSSSTSYVDNRSEGYGELTAQMSKVARQNSGSHSLSYYSRVDFSISSSVSPGRIKFTLSYTVHVSNSVTNESQVQTLQNDLQSAIESVAEDIKRDASNTIDNLRDTYKSYDGAYSIEFAQGSVRTVQD